MAVIDGVYLSNHTSLRELMAIYGYGESRGELTYNRADDIRHTSIAKPRLNKVYADYMAREESI